ncbi:NPC intracellular cholesterol transporter 1 homolog 1b-like [Plodia interpunctella]|uniref:NPC intracellular cholesterol transporter 1 homolog 1b-like n=1 Tax=Plodia interpunctella TaxID=58824 RepID=UPI002367D3B1|nr:NPC intracellular cholesterol transporter 1 homolog 1b-like [Plodia interpunctella]XP_053603223.1 NPC intracellular cholesterol transporter 1 homolog 1b-like [Plodia interpunctella]
MPMKKKLGTLQQMWETASSTLVHIIERIFFTLGVSVARHPWRTIALSWLFILLSSIGLIKFHIEKNPMNLWVPPDSDFFYDTHWYMNKFETNFRLQKIIITADDVLQPKVLSAISDISEKISSIQVLYENKAYSIKDLCFKVPVVKIFGSSRKTRYVDQHSVNNSAVKANSSHEFLDTNLWMGYDFYCGFLNNFPLVCHQYNILDLFENDINSTTKYDIVNRLNNVKNNPVTGHPMDYTKLLGGVKHDENGDIVSANAIILTWFTSVNMSAVDLNTVGNLVGTEDWVSVPLALWEKEFINLMELVSTNLTDLGIFYEAGRSFGDISGQAILNEIDKLFLGIILMFFYIQFALSRFNWLEIRLTLGSVGLLSVGMAYISAVSWCSLMGISFGPVHSSLPFLLMGLGVDDMFVISACWRNLTEAEQKKSLPDKVGLMLEHAGVSIVITSFTDIVALLIGAITILPSLKSFCLYAAVGVFFIFCFTVTFYVAVFTLDIRRIEDNRNGVFFCYKHSKPIKISQNQTLFQRAFERFYKNIVFSIPGKTIIILFTLIMTGFSIAAMLRLEQRFDPKWFIPDDTYYKDFLNTHEYYFPEEGYPSMIFLGEMNYHDEFANLLNLTQTLAKEPYVNEISSWVENFHGYVLENYGHDLRNKSEVTKDEFREYLSKFLFSSIGGRFQLNFKFQKPIECGHPTTDIRASSVAFRFKTFKGPEEYLPAMNNVKHIVKSTPVSSGDGYRSVWSKEFGNWVTDEIIAVEVERNVELALLCVIACTIVLITNLQMCFWIFLCVLLTIVNVLGWMQRWGMTVDIVCCIGLELAIGLCVDYAAHIGHTFLTVSEGRRSARALKTVTSIGTAVLLGGGSTLLSLSLLSMSKAYTFQSFFKIFLLVILFGLFNGLLFLPVVLSLIGPSAYRPLRDTHETAEIELNVKPDDEETQELNGKFQ